MWAEARSTSSGAAGPDVCPPRGGTAHRVAELAADTRSFAFCLRFMKKIWYSIGW